MSQAPLPNNQELKLWFGARKDEKKLKRIFVTAYKVWESISTDGKRFYYSGLHFVAPEDETMNKIQELLYNLNDEWE